MDRLMNREYRRILGLEKQGIKYKKRGTLPEIEVFRLRGVAEQHPGMNVCVVWCPL